MSGISELLRPLNGSSTRSDNGAVLGWIGRLLVSLTSELPRDDVEAAW
jgi:hypothetical protein